MFSLEQNGENLMISLEIDLEQIGTHLKEVRKSNFLIIQSPKNRAFSQFVSYWTMLC